MLYPFEDYEHFGNIEDVPKKSNDIVIEDVPKKSNDIVIEEKLDMIKQKKTQLNAIQNAYDSLKEEEESAEEKINYETIELQKYEEEYEEELLKYEEELKIKELERYEEEEKLKEAKIVINEELSKLQLEENEEETLNINKCIADFDSGIYDDEKIIYNSNEYKINNLRNELTKAKSDQLILSTKESEINTINDNRNKCKNNVETQINNLKDYLNTIETNKEEIKNICVNNGFYVNYMDSLSKNNIWDDSYSDSDKSCKTFNFCKKTHDNEIQPITDEVKDSVKKQFDIDFYLNTNFCPNKFTIDPKWSIERNKLKLKLDDFNIKLGRIQANIDLLDNKLKTELPAWKAIHIDSLKIKINDIKLKREKINLDLKLKMDKLKSIQLNINGINSELKLYTKLKFELSELSKLKQFDVNYKINIKKKWDFIIGSLNKVQIKELGLPEWDPNINWDLFMNKLNLSELKLDGGIMELQRIRNELSNILIKSKNIDFSKIINIDLPDIDIPKVGPRDIGIQFRLSDLLIIIFTIALLYVSYLIYKYED